jgi:hypothetical protein
MKFMDRKIRCSSINTFALVPSGIPQNNSLHIEKYGKTFRIWVGYAPYLITTDLEIIEVIMRFSDRKKCISF